MPEINFMTIGDKNYFYLINFSAKQLMKLYPSCNFYVYDWGFTSSQKKELKSYPITILINWNEKLDKVNGYKKIISHYKEDNIPIEIRKKEYLLNQKPLCMLDCTKRIKNNLFFLDGDAFLIKKIDEILEDDFDIGITIRSKDEIERERKYGRNITPVNSGIIFFKLNAIPMRLFIEEWIKEINKTKSNLIEQTALNNLAKKYCKNLYRKPFNTGFINLYEEKIKIKTFPCTEYNCYLFFNKKFDFNKVKILHFMGCISSYKIREKIFKIKLYHSFKILKLVKLIPWFLRNKIDSCIENKIEIKKLTNVNSFSILKIIVSMIRDLVKNIIFQK